MARRRGSGAGHAQVLLLRVAQYTQIGGLLHAAVAGASSSTAAGSTAGGTAPGQDTDVIQVRDDVGCAGGRQSTASSAPVPGGVAAGGAAGAAATRGAVAVLLMAARGEVAGRRLGLGLDFDGNGWGGRWRRAIRDSQVWETERQAEFYLEYNRTQIWSPGPT